jgi:hypothetical protein
MRLHITLLDFAVRSEEADELAEEAITWLEDAGGGRLAGAASLLMWFAMGFIRSGRWSRAEEVLARSGTYHLEGMVVMSYLTLRALLHWSQGRLDEAAEDVAALRATGPRPRYYRVLHTIDANVRRDQGDLDAVRAVADEHMQAAVEPVEEPTKAGTLQALVRAEVDAALDSDGPARDDHRGRAEAAIRTIRSLISRYPPRTLSGLQLEGAEVSLALAEAELSRLDEPRPDLWRALLDRPWYAYWRTYARIRLAESLLALDHRAEGEAELEIARRDADRIGAPILRDEIDGVARRAGVETVTTGSGSPGTGRPGRSGP